MKGLKLAAAIAAMIIGIAGQAAAERQVKIFVFADSGGVVDEKSESAKDLAETFTRADDPKAAKEKIVLVDARSEADVVVEITGRGFVDTGRRVQDFGGSHETRAHQVTAKLTIGTYSTELSGMSVEAVKPWRDAVSRLHGNIEKFVKKNGDQFAK